MPRLSKVALLLVVTLGGAAALVASRPTPARAQGAGTTLVGQDNPSVDTAALQTAINNGGTVYLQGTFDLGGGHLEVTNDVELIGEEPVESGGVDPVTKNKQRTWKTLIKRGGEDPYANSPPPGPGPTVPDWYSAVDCRKKVNLTLRNIHFDESTSMTLKVEKGLRVEVSSCKFTNVIPTFNLPGYQTIFGMAHPIAFVADLGIPDVNEIVVKDNVLDIVDMNNHADWYQIGFGHLTIGIAVHSIPAANILIKGNLVKNFTHLGIAAFSGGNVTIENNRTDTGDRSNDYGFTGWGIGITSDWYVRNPAVPLGKVLIRNNSIRSVKYGAVGIAHNSQAGTSAPDSAVVISNNNLYVEDPFGTDSGGFAAGVGIWGFANDLLFTNNKIEGTMWAGMDIEGRDVGYNDHNTYQGNTLSGAMNTGMFLLAVTNSVLAGNDLQGVRLTGSPAIPPYWFGFEIPSTHIAALLSFDNTFVGGVAGSRIRVQDYIWDDIPNSTNAYTGLTPSFGVIARTPENENRVAEAMRNKTKFRELQIEEQ